MDDNEDEEISKMAFASFQAREEEIERKKMEVRERVQFQLGRAEEETRRLAQVWEVSLYNINEQNCLIKVVSFLLSEVKSLILELYKHFIRSWKCWVIP